MRQMQAKLHDSKSKWNPEKKSTN